MEGTFIVQLGMLEVRSHQQDRPKLAKKQPTLTPLKNLGNLENVRVQLTSEDWGLLCSFLDVGYHLTSSLSLCNLQIKGRNSSFMTQIKFLVSQEWKETQSRVILFFK